MKKLTAYSLYYNQVSNSSDLYEKIEAVDYIATCNAFLQFSKVETKEQMEQYVKEACRGQLGNRILEFNDEKIAIEFLENSVKVTLYSPVSGRNNRYFEYLK